MKKVLPLLHILVLTSIMSFGQAKINNKDSSAKKAPAPKDRDMFGMHIPRGLTIASAGLTDGYVMYAVCNSASVYLVNRKGEVVHEWKGNYGVLGAYLNDDGSLMQNAKQLDYHVFTDP